MPFSVDDIERYVKKISELMTEKGIREIEFKDEAKYIRIVK